MGRTMQKVYISSNKVYGDGYFDTIADARKWIDGVLLFYYPETLIQWISERYVKWGSNYVEINQVKVKP